MRINKLKQKLTAGQPVTVISPFATSAGLVELLGHYGFDGVFLDGEHGPPGWEDIEHMVRAAEVADYDAIVRVDRNDAATITRALDRGASGVQVPHINTAAEAQALVQHAKYAPLGQRGWSGWRSALGSSASTYAEDANAQTLVVAMIEEVEALANLDEILRVEHIDVFFVAPGDLAQSMGLQGKPADSRVQTAIDDALRRIRQSGRVAGTLTTPADVDHHLQLGVQFLYVGLGSLLGPAATEFVRRAQRSELLPP
jgi:4-hydroxy-2-oxoheptanedioate aldolase